MPFPSGSFPTLRFPAAALAWAAIVCVAVSTSARADSAPGFDPRSTPAHPCGVGTPAPGHALPEIRPGPEGLHIAVRQDGARLCYVVEGNADAPVIRVARGSDLVVTLDNEIRDPAVIDTVTTPGKLHMANVAVPRTPGYYEVEAGMKHRATGTTNLHVHGFSVSPIAPQDDVLTVCTDPNDGTTRCGQRSYTYRYHVPADMPEGLYWYHPHVHGEVQAQMLMGLAGAIVVEGPQDVARRKQGIEDQVLIVRQTQDNDAGKMQAATMTSAAPVELAPARRGTGVEPPPDRVDTAHELLCAAGSAVDQISLNGTPVAIGDAPDQTLARVEIAGGGRRLLRILNAATDAFLKLNIVDEKGTVLPLTVIARDGASLTDDRGTPLAQRQTVESQLVPPSGRIEVLVDAPLNGGKSYLLTRAIDSGCAGDRLPERRLAVIVAVPPNGQGLPISSPAIRSKLEMPGLVQPDLYSGLLARPAQRKRILAFAEYPRPGQEDQTDFYLFERKPGAVLKPYEKGDPPAITVDAGTVEEWTIENWTNELHAFHTHQVHFRVLEIDGKALENPPLLDVVSVPYASATGYHSTEGPVRPGRVRVKIEFPPSMAGDIPVHCHLVDHEDNGMMLVVRVRPAVSAAQTAPHTN